MNDVYLLEDDDVEAVEAEAVNCQRYGTDSTLGIRADWLRGMCEELRRYRDIDDPKWLVAYKEQRTRKKRGATK